MSGNNLIVGILKKEGLYLDINEIVAKKGKEYYNKFRNKYALQTYNNNTKQYKKLKVYKIINDKYILIPRFDGLKSKIIDGVVNKINNHFETIEMVYSGLLIKNQKLISEYLLENIYNKKNKKSGNAGCILKMPAGCHAINTPIMMYNGNIQLVQYIKQGDILMGDDSKPRNVIELISNRECMYKITEITNSEHPVNYTVNGNHILCLKEIKKKSKNSKNIKEITVLDYLALPDGVKNRLYAYRSPVKFKTIETDFDSYTFGYMIGRNTFNTYPIINISDENVYERLSNKFYLGYFQHTYDENYKFMYHNRRIVNFVKTYKDYFNNLNLLKNKNDLRNGNFTIPHDYKCNSRKNRLQLLAGLLDATFDEDLKLYDENDELIYEKYTMDDYVFITNANNNKLIKDVKFIVYSLGFSFETISKNDKIYIYINTDGIYLDCCHYTSIYPEQTDVHHSLYKFTVEKLEEDIYYGFLLDGNHRYLMEDCTVTHNTGKSFVAMHMIAKLKTKTLIIVPNTYLLKQWTQLLIQLFPNNKIGEYYSKSKIDGDIVVSIINSCIQDKFQYKNAEEELSIKDYYKQFNFVVLDECHMYCTQTFGEVFNRIQSTYMLGLSATPDERLDGFDTVARYHLGDIVDVENIEYYNKEDIKFTSNVKIIKYNGPDAFAQVVINEKNNMINVPAMISNFIVDEHRNNLIVNETIKLLGNNHNIFIFSDRRSHLQMLSELLIDKVNTDHKIILYGGSTDDDIGLAQKNSKIILTTYQYSSTGVSISKMDALILSTPRRNNMTQIIGRIFRLNKETQGNLRSIIDIVDNKNPLKFQFNSRKSAYLARGATLKFETIDYENLIC